jgi:molybdate transport system regulatory protein
MPAMKRAAARRLRIKSKIWVEAGGRMIFSDGRLGLLEAVDELGSLRRAAQRLGMSYRAAWGLLKVTEKALGYAILHVRIGGACGGGATLTPAGAVLVRRFRRVKRQVNRTADRAFARAFARR